MAADEHKRCEKSRPSAVHAQRDIEEQERLRQLGGIVVHDLNNAMFALLGRTQLLKRQASDPELQQSVVNVYDTVKLLESLITKLHAACQREASSDERSNLRAAVLLGLRHALGTLPESIRPGGDLTLDAWLEQEVDHLPRDLFYDGSITQVTTALAQMISGAAGDAPDAGGGPFGVTRGPAASGAVRSCCGRRRAGGKARAPRGRARRSRRRPAPCRR